MFLYTLREINIIQLSIRVLNLYCSCECFEKDKKKIAQEGDFFNYFFDII